MTAIARRDDSSPARQDPGVRLDSRQFMWHKATRTFVAEASDLGLRPGEVLVTLISRYPGRDDLHFTLAHTETDREGDVMFWELRAPGAPFTLKIFND